MVLLSESPLNAILIPYLGATLFATKLTSDCSAALPSAVATSSVAPVISLGDFFGVSRGMPITATAARTRTVPPAIQGQRRRRFSSNPWSGSLGLTDGRVAVSLLMMRSWLWMGLLRVEAEGSGAAAG